MGQKKQKLQKGSPTTVSTATATQGQQRDEDATKDLDAELADRLEKTLDAGTKRELQAEAVLARLSRVNGREDDAATVETSDYKSDASNPFDSDDGPRLEDAKADLAIESGAEAAVTIARVAFRDGGCFEFLAVPGDGEIGLAYVGEDDRRWGALDGNLLSPLRLYCSLAPPGAPLPWLLAAVDRQPDRAALVGSRPLCGSVEEVLLSESDTVRLRVPALPGGWWTPDDFGIGGYCGVNGQYEWASDICGFPGELSSGNNAFFPIIWRCESQLKAELTHNSIRGGTWRRRKTSFARCAPCGSPVRVTHRYRKLGFFKWTWKTATSHVYEVGPHNQVKLSPWLGIVRRRRQIIYKREGAVGGFRVLSRFAQTLVGDH